MDLSKLNISKAAYINALEDGTAYFFEIFAKVKNKHLYDNNYIKWIISCPETFPNLIFNTRFNKDTAKQRIEEIANQIKEGKIPNAWFIGPRSTPDNLRDLLIESGFKQDEDQEGPGMALNLNEIKPELDIPVRLIIKQVNNLNDFETWVDIANRVLMGKGALNDCIYAKVNNEPTLKLYLAFWDDKPVATSMYALKDNIADVDIIATLPEYRNRGIATAITLTTLHDLKKIGAQIAILRASQMGESIYRKIGFKEYCRYQLFSI